MNKTIWLLQKPIVWTDVCNVENVKRSVLLKQMLQMTQPCNALQVASFRQRN